MYRCDDCYAEFETPKLIKDSESGDFHVCPHCGKSDYYEIIECSECGCGFNLVGMFTHYCPNCGAKMDKKQNANAKVKVIYMITLER